MPVGRRRLVDRVGRGVGDGGPADLDRLGHWPGWCRRRSPSARSAGRGPGPRPEFTRGHVHGPVRRPPGRPRGDDEQTAQRAATTTTATRRAASGASVGSPRRCRWWLYGAGGTISWSRRQWPGSSSRWRATGGGDAGQRGHGEECVGACRRRGRRHAGVVRERHHQRVVRRAARADRQGCSSSVCELPLVPVAKFHVTPLGVVARQPV